MLFVVGDDAFDEHCSNLEFLLSELDAGEESRGALEEESSVDESSSSSECGCRSPAARCGAASFAFVMAAFEGSLAGVGTGGPRLAVWC